jgi:hypothetical protein
VDADGAEDNHAIAAPTARARAVVALRAVNNCTRLPQVQPGQLFTAPTGPTPPGVIFGEEIACPIDPSVQTVCDDEIADHRAIVDRIAIPLASIYICADRERSVRGANAGPAEV